MYQLIQFAGNHPWLVSATALTLVLLIVFELRLRQADFAAVSPQDVIRLSNSGALLLDLRKPEEYAAGHIAGARRIDTTEILKAGDTLKKHREKPVVVYCDSGSLGASAARILSSQGFTKAVNLRGGLGTWRAESLPLVKDGR